MFIIIEMKLVLVISDGNIAHGINISNIGN